MLPSEPADPTRTRRSRVALTIGITAVAVLAVAILWPVLRPSGGASFDPDTMGNLTRDLRNACGQDLGTLSSTVTGYDIATGEVRWTTDMPVSPAGTAGLIDGNLVVGVAPNRGELVLDPRTGSVIASHDPASITRSQIVDMSDWPGAPVTAGVATIQTTEGQLTVDEAGVERWSAPLPRGGGSSRPLVDDDLVLVVSSDQLPTCI